MRRFIAVFVATVAGLVVLLSFKTAPAKAPHPVALSGATPGESSGPPGSSAAVSSAAASSVASSSPAESSAPASAPQPSPAATSSAAATAPSKSPSAKASPTPTKTTAKPTPKPTPKPSSTTKTVTGSTVTVSEGGRRVFGAVQVQVTLTNGKITAVTALQEPENDPHSSQISQFSIPILRQEVLSAQSASIDAVSGATYTSEAYAQSVQAALDAAKA
jgi:uncharacterized protein with FMN-binding domain